MIEINALYKTSNSVIKISYDTIQPGIILYTVRTSAVFSLWISVTILQ